MQIASSTRSFSLYAKLGFEVQEGAFNSLLKRAAAVLHLGVRSRPITIVASDAVKYHGCTCYLVKRQSSSGHTDIFRGQSAAFYCEPTSRLPLRIAIPSYHRTLVGRENPQLFDRVHCLDLTKRVPTNGVTLSS